MNSSKVIQMTRFLTGAPVVASAGFAAPVALTPAGDVPVAPAAGPGVRVSGWVAGGAVGGAAVVDGEEVAGGKTVVVPDPVARAEPTERVTAAARVVALVGTGPLKSQVAATAGAREAPIRSGQMFMVWPLTVSVRAVILPEAEFELVTTTR